MKTVSVRLGFATNSSSAHSVITGHNDFSDLTNAEIAERYSGHGHRDFGWDEEVWDSEDSIVNYGLLLFIDIFGPVEGSVLSEEVRTIIEKYKVNEDRWGGSIDHQSGSDEYGKPGVTKEKEELFWDFVRNTSRIIGGNDNG